MMTCRKKVFVVVGGKASYSVRYNLYKIPANYSKTVSLGQIQQFSIQLEKHMGTNRRETDCSELIENSFTMPNPTISYSTYAIKQKHMAMK